MTEVATETSAPKAKKVKVKLLGTHTHQRKAYEKDDVIEVLPHTAEKLVERKIAVRA